MIVEKFPQVELDRLLMEAPAKAVPDWWRGILDLHGYAIDDPELDMLDGQSAVEHIRANYGCR